MRLYLDANPIIYSIEGVPAFRQAALQWIERAETGGGLVITSRLSRLECRVKPLRDDNTQLLALFESFFARESLELVEITAEEVEAATQLRATHNFRAPDAIHLASAVRAKAGVFLTADRNLARCPGLNAEVLTEPRDVPKTVEPPLAPTRASVRSDGFFVAGGHAPGSTPGSGRARPSRTSPSS